MNLAWLHVAVVYAAAVALARRARVDLPWRVAGLFYLLVLAFFFRPMTGPYVNVAPEVLQLLPPWSASAPPGFDKYDVSNYELQDIVFQFIPWTKQVHDQWRTLQVPLWNDFAASGMPLMANMQSGALSPLRILTIPLPLLSAFAAEAALKILVALTFTFLYCRRRYDVLPSVVAAVSFGFGTFMTIWLHFPHPNVAAFLPAVLYQLELLAERVTFGRFAFAACLGPVLLAGGHPETTAHVVFFAALYAAWLILVEKRALLRPLLAVSIVSLLLAAPVLLPVVEALRLSASLAQVRAESHAAGTAYSDFASLALLVHPRIYGERPGPLWGNAVTENMTGFAGILAVGSWFGMLAWVVATRRFRERETFYLVMTALLFLWIDDAPFVSAPVRTLFSIALNGRFRLQFTFLLAVQAAALLHYVRRDRFMPIAAAVGGAVATLAVVMTRTTFPTAEAKSFAITTLLPSAIVLLLTALLFVRRARVFVLPLLVVAVYTELWQAGRNWHPVRRESAIYRRTPLITDLAARRGPEPFRIVGLGGTLFPNTNAPFGFEDVRAKDAMASARYMSLLRATKGWDPKAYYEKWMDADTPLLDELNVKWVLTAPGEHLADTARYRLVYDGPDGRIYENLRVRPRFHAPDAFLNIANRGGGAYDLDVDAKTATRIVSSVAWWPGWRITYNGKRIPTHRVNEAFVGFDVPAGHGVVRLRYRPWSFWGGVALAAITAAGLLLWRWKNAPAISPASPTTATPAEA
jgi:hypothetical protein